MSGRARDTAQFAWDLIRNPLVEWEDVDSGVVERERFTRIERWHTFRPIWTFRVLTRKYPCGCSKRFGLWYVMYCQDHASAQIAPEVTP